MMISYISDCRDENARGRLVARVGSFFKGGVNFVGVANEFEAAICLVDVLDAYDGEEGVVFSNVAPRNRRAKKWVNGTPFGHVKVGRVDVFTTVDGMVLSLLQKLSGKKLEVRVYGIPETVKKMELGGELREKLIKTQFRSFEYLPRLAREVRRGVELGGEVWSEVPEMPAAVCFTDCFGNVKLSLTSEEVGLGAGEMKRVCLGENVVELKCYERLKDIPDGEMGLTVGSSGLGAVRLCEVMCQGGSAAEKTGARSGMGVEILN